MNKELDDKTIQIDLPNRLGYERVAMTSSASFARIFGLEQDRIEDLKTAVGEACINAMQHGNKWRSDARVTVRINIQDTELVVTVMDEGTGVSTFKGIGRPPIGAQPCIDRIIDNLDPPAGFGTFIIKKLVDDVDFNTLVPNGHVVRMVFRLIK